ncbi:MAG: MtnX-like HAD-IB family phosphatase [Nitrospirales bacterium]|nr:MtnX-like HAD-IB family phosphatase [Nitrospirales bacterium]
MLNHHPFKQANLHSRRCAGRTEVFCAFDGTITCRDATVAVLETFALPAWREWEQRWVNGEISTQECLSRQVELISADRETLIRFAADLPIDEGIFALERQCAEYDIPLTIISDGLDVLIEATLRRHNLLHIPVLSNHLCWDTSGRLFPTYPFSMPECTSRSGICKCALAQLIDSTSSHIIYIGDGQSDRCVSDKVQTLFAKGTLQTWCRNQMVPFRSFNTLTDVAEQISSKKVLMF